MTGIDAAGDLHVLVALSSADLRIGAVNDVLDLAELSAPHGARFTMRAIFSITGRSASGVWL